MAAPCASSPSGIAVPLQHGTSPAEQKLSPEQLRSKVLRQVRVWVWTHAVHRR